MSTSPVSGPGTIPQFTLPDRLRKAREHAGLDQQELAERIRVDRKTISNNELGRVKPRGIVLSAWALATGVDLQWLETGNALQPQGPEGDDGCAIRDSNPEPAGSRQSRHLTVLTAA